MFYSIVGSDDKWTCEIESANHSSNINLNNIGGHYICVEMRRTMNCKTISGPIRSEIFLKVKKDLQASAIVSMFYSIDWMSMGNCSFRDKIMLYIAINF